MPRLTIRDNEQILLDGQVVAYLTNELTYSPILRERLLKVFELTDNKEPIPLPG